MQTQQDRNTIILRGELGQAPRGSHESHGVEYETFPLRVARLSGTEDELNVLAARGQLAGLGLVRGDAVEVTGEVRSFNNRSGQGSRLVISVLARTVVRTQEEAENRLTLTGTLCKVPVYRRTPLGRDICDILLAVNRRYGRTDYLPCISWGTLAIASRELGVGTRVALEGRLQSRVYHKEEGGVKVAHTAFEVSVMTMEVEES